MACRGVFFAVTSAQKDHLMVLESDDKRLRYIQEEIEGAWDEQHLMETDKAWDAMHRCLTDGTLAVSRSSQPLGKLILGGTQLYSDSQSYVINLVESSELPQVSTALNAITKDWFKKQYERLKTTDYPGECISDEDLEYTWGWFSGVPDFVNRAVQEGRSIIFTVDQ
jgi:Domain of unknown function (DUF1877)